MPMNRYLLLWGLLWGLAGTMGPACSALWAAQPQDEAGLPINVGMTGSWANSDIPGQGLFIDIDPANRTVFLAWFTYSDSPSASESTIGSASHRWFIALGNYFIGYIFHNYNRTIYDDTKVNGS